MPSAFTDSVIIQAGQKFSIALEANPSTGYQWELSNPLDTRYLHLLASEYVPPLSPGTYGAKRISAGDAIRLPTGDDIHLPEILPSLGRWRLPELCLLHRHHYLAPAQLAPASPITSHDPKRGSGSPPPHASAGSLPLHPGQRSYALP